MWTPFSTIHSASLWHRFYLVKPLNHPPDLNCKFNAKHCLLGKYFSYFLWAKNLGDKLDLSNAPFVNRQHGILSIHRFEAKILIWNRRQNPISVLKLLTTRFSKDFCTFCPPQSQLARKKFIFKFASRLLARVGKLKVGSLAGWIDEETLGENLCESFFC